VSLSISKRLRMPALALVSLSFALAADQPGIRAPLQPAGQREAAPSFALEDSRGETIGLKQYRGKVVLLDFWATWCTGCKKEIPWFSEFQKLYGARGFAVVGVSMDEDGWKVLKPFLAEHRVPYRMLLGDKLTAQRYRIESLPDTFLIDRKGRMAAAYIAGLVDKESVETNIQTLLANH
jgi:peroxiredoxin